MVGTSHEILLLLSYQEGVAKELKITPQRLVSLRQKIVQRKLTEEYIIDCLLRLGCRCIRPRVVLPRIVKDKNGRLFDEYTFVMMFFTHEMAEKYHADYDATMRCIKRGRSMNRPLFKHLLKSRRAWIVKDNMILDSIWSYEPIELTFTKEKVAQIRGMLSSSIPVSDNPYDIVTYQMQSPSLQDLASE